MRPSEVGGWTVQGTRRSEVRSARCVERCARVFCPCFASGRLSPQKTRSALPHAPLPLRLWVYVAGRLSPQKTSPLYPVQSSLVDYGLK